MKKIKKVSYLAISLLILALLSLNIYVNNESMKMAEKAMNYETQIKVLKQANVTLESNIAKSSSFHFISLVAESAGYSTDARYMHMPTQVFARK